jgi:hypothetical protein
MGDEVQETLAAEVEQVPADPWAVAFAALDTKDEEDTEAGAGADSAGDGGTLPDTDEADGSQGALDAEEGHCAGVEDVAGGPGDLGGEAGEEDVRFDWDDVDVSEEGIARFKEQVTNDIRERTMRDVVNAYIRQGARNVNGQLGATINDSDVCKRDEDGVPRFYNPETGREFTGDNPRRQAQEWVDDYNRELAEAFNRTCRDYEQKLLQQEGNKIAVVEFAPKYRQLDPMRRSMFDAVIEDYEVTDKNGDVVGYSCDLNKALAAVNRQVAAIQRQYSKTKQAAPQPVTPPSGPALDTPSTSGSAQKSGKPQFKSIEEAMEWEQDQLLAKMKGSAR